MKSCFNFLPLLTVNLLKKNSECYVLAKKELFGLFGG